MKISEIAELMVATGTLLTGIASVVMAGIEVIADGSNYGTYYISEKNWG